MLSRLFELLLLKRISPSDRAYLLLLAKIIKEKDKK